LKEDSPVKGLGKSIEDALIVAVSSTKDAAYALSILRKI
jgi:hypothetical protein